MNHAKILMFFILLALLLPVAALAQDVNQAKQDLSADLDSHIKSKLKNILPNGAAIEVRDFSKSTVRVAITAPNALKSMRDAEIVGRHGVDVVLKFLIAQGRNPREEWISVSCWVRSEAGSGATGSRQVRQYGVARYNYNHDQIEWKASN